MQTRGFKDIEVASNMVKAVNKAATRKVFCPITKENCRTDCASFEKAYLIENLFTFASDNPVNRVAGYRCCNGIVNEPQVW